MSDKRNRAAISEALTPHVLWAIFGGELFAAMPEGYYNEMLRAAKMQASMEHQLSVVNAARARDGEPLLSMSEFMAGGGE